jgi:flavin-dependent dehydrogenase
MRLLVNGAGPAGIAAAITAVGAGIETTLLCKRPNYFSKGQEPLQSVHPGLETLLKSMSCHGAMIKSSRGTYEGIWSGGNFAPLSTEADETWYGHHICRETFDDFLLTVARSKNIKIVTADRRVTVNSITYDYLIDASGRSRVMGKLMGIQEDFHSPQLTACSGVASGLLPAFFEQHQTSFLPESNGWTWLAPEPPTKCSWTRLIVTGNQKPFPPSLFNEKEVDLRFIRSANMRWRVFRPLVSDRVLLTGDAAGILDPGAGQGILNACYSGIMAARALIAINEGQFAATTALAYYDDWFMGHYLQKVAALRDYYKNLGIIFFNDEKTRFY